MIGNIAVIFARHHRKILENGGLMHYCDRVGKAGSRRLAASASHSSCILKVCR
jgi:hypothetical protein